MARAKGASETVRSKVRRVVLGGGPEFAARTVAHLRDQGWDVFNAETDADLHSMTLRKNPAAVLLPVETTTESGYLTCAKLRLMRPKLRIILVGEPTPRAQLLAGFVGAGIASEETAADVVMKLI